MSLGNEKKIDSFDKNYNRKNLEKQTPMQLENVEKNDINKPNKLNEIDIINFPNATRIRFFVNKIVRDKIPEELKKNPATIASFKNLSEKKRKYAVLKKLLEECNELNVAIKFTQKNQILEELADVYDVFIHILNKNKIKIAKLLGIVKKEEKKPEVREKFNNEQKKFKGQTIIRNMYNYAKNILVSENNTQFLISCQDFFNSFLELLDLQFISLSKLNELSQEKAQKRGEFNQEIFVHYIEYDIKDPLVKKYLRKYKYFILNATEEIIFKSKVENFAVKKTEKAIVEEKNIEDDEDKLFHFFEEKLAEN